tara:strand:- start:533 stop:1558 length:1026 start_codon:yes stop_codon:yes gene_type:complete
MTKRATILDVAKACGLSQATVARVLNSQTDIQVKENTRKKVLLAAENIGYKRNIIAANFRQQKTKNIAISIADITNPFFPELIKGIQTKMREHGYSIVQLNNEWDPEIEQENFNYMMQTRVDGAIISPAHQATNFGVLGNTPFILITNSNHFSKYDTIGNDSRRGMIMALERLFELGHRRIALLAGGSMRGGSSWRFDTIKEFYSKKNMSFPEGLNIHCDMNESSLASFSKARSSVRNFLESGKSVTAIFASNDILAIAALHVANEKGIKIPKELSIVGMDGILLSEITYPSLTTVEKNRSKIGSLAAESLIQKINNPFKWQTKKVILPCKLIERNSTGPI